LRLAAFFLTHSPCHLVLFWCPYVTYESTWSSTDS
jgi:hypothetical protein